MLNIELVRRHHEQICQSLETRGEDVQDAVARLLILDKQRRELVSDRDALRAKRNETSKKIGRLRAASDGNQRQELIEEMRLVGDRIDESGRVVTGLEEEINVLLLSLPNIPLEDVPVGLDESANRIIRTQGAPQEFSFVPRAHWELGESLDLIDLQRGAKLSGTRFYVAKGWGARLQRALVTWMLTMHIQEHGYTEMSVPYLVRRETMVGSGNLPKFGDNLYHDDEDDLWLIPTAEVPLTNLHRDEILAPGTLPMRYVAHTPCFRREKAAAGKETRGIKRVHQFDKVELYKFVEPEHSDKELESMVRDAENICFGLEIPYRVVQLCTGELGFPSAKSYDLEMWAPGTQEWLEVSSCSNCTDFQSRRANIRYRVEPGGPLEHVHTLNGSGLAVPRVLIAILENYQREDGSVLVPEVLRPYMGVEIIEAPGCYDQRN